MKLLASIKYLIVLLTILSIIGLMAGTSMSAQTASVTTSPTMPGATSSASPTATPSALNQYTVGISTKAGIGQYLVDGDGMTLYVNVTDTNGHGTFQDTNPETWPEFLSVDQNEIPALAVPPDLNPVDFGTITNTDGSMQTTYYGWPLYYYIGDNAPGDTKGAGLNGEWFVVEYPFYTVWLQTKAGIGQYLTDGDGMTLYWTTQDTIGQSNVNDFKTWPFFLSLDSFGQPDIIIPSTLKYSDFGTILRSDGSSQTTYHGWPLYYYIGDNASGDINGNGNGGVWFLVSPKASSPAPLSPVPSSSALSSPAPSSPTASSSPTP